MIPGATYDKENRSEPVAARYYAKSKARLSYNTDFLMNNTIADTRTRYPLVQEDYKVNLMVSSGTHNVVKNKSYKKRNVVIISPVQMVMKEAVKKPEARRYLKDTVRKELNNSLPNRIHIWSVRDNKNFPYAELFDLTAKMNLGSNMNQVSGMILNPTSLQLNLVASIVDANEILEGALLSGCVLLFQMKGKYLQEASLNLEEIWTRMLNAKDFEGLGCLGYNRDSYIKSLAYIPFTANDGSPSFTGTANCTDLEKIYLTADTSVAPTVYSGNLYALGLFNSLGKTSGTLSVYYSLNVQLNYTCQ